MSEEKCVKCGHTRKVLNNLGIRLQPNGLCFECARELAAWELIEEAEQI